jgi:hypothetical protein
VNRSCAQPIYAGKPKCAEAGEICICTALCYPCPSRSPLNISACYSATLHIFNHHSNALIKKALSFSIPRSSALVPIKKTHIPRTDTLAQISPVGDLCLCWSIEVDLSYANSKIDRSYTFRGMHFRRSVMHAWGFPSWRYLLGDDQLGVYEEFPR